ncbi:MAG: fibronectin type III domain-containing protein [Deltaproteobacteria bacterium]|nr:fibronectin type III domain-containing protein [Deltaproteobacteria bacterium]
MWKLSIVLGACCLVALSWRLVPAADFKLPQRLRPGDVISADVFNELFDYLEQSTKAVTTADLDGRWSCTKFQAGASDGYEAADEDGLWFKAAVSLTVTRTGGGSFSYTSTPLSAFEPGADNCTDGGKISVASGMLAAQAKFTCGSSTTTRQAQVKRTSPTQLRMELIANNVMMSLLCDKQGVPPAGPTQLRAILEGGSVSLTWTDNSADETAFTILRRDSLESSYVEVVQLATDVTSATDTLTAPGIYWYRVLATNANGASVASNVASVTLP